MCQFAGMTFYLKSLHGAAAEKMWKLWRMALIWSSEHICTFKIQHKKSQENSSNQEISSNNSSQNSIPYSSSPCYFPPVPHKELPSQKMELTAFHTIKQSLIQLTGLYFFILRTRKTKLFCSLKKFQRHLWNSS